MGNAVFGTHLYDPGKQTKRDMRKQTAVERTKVMAVAIGGITADPRERTVFCNPALEFG